MLSVRPPIVPEKVCELLPVPVRFIAVPAVALLDEDANFIVLSSTIIA